MKKLFQKKNKYVIIFGLLLINQLLSSQNIEDIYVNMPDTLNPTLSRQNRLELIEYHKAHQSDSIANKIGNEAYLMSLDTLNERIVVKNTQSSTFEMKILQLEDSSKIIGIIRTVCAPVCMSSIEFYDLLWKWVVIPFQMPKSIEWLEEKNIPSDKIDVQWVKNVLDVSFISLSFSADSQVVIAKNNTLDFLSEADRKIIAPYVNAKPFQFKLINRAWNQIQ